MAGSLKIIVILLCAGTKSFLYGKPIYRTGKFVYSQCTQERASENTLTCEPLNITKVRRDKSSLWPPGPYAILMPNGKCPEPESHGWKKGVFIIKASSKDEVLKLNFCVKVNRNPELALEKQKWMSGTYSIHMSGETCPEGFTDFNRTVEYETFSHFGLVPNVSIVDDSEKNSITFHMCGRDSTSVSRIEEGFGKVDTEFLCKKFMEDEDCVGTKKPRRVLELVSDFYMSSGTLQERIMGKRIVWYQFDLGRTLSVSLISIRQEKNKRSLNRWFANSYLSCNYDNVKWNFIYKDAAACNTRIAVNTYVKLRMRNVVKGRFITLLLKETNSFQKLLLKENIKIVLSNLPENDMCNEDLGMGDGSIQDFQITASSWLPQYMPSAARPLSAGWCAAVTDSKPWILVDLIAVTRVEGLSMWLGELSKDIVLFNSTGCSSFDLFYGLDIEALVMHTDTDFSVSARRMTEVQTFTLLNTIDARYVKLEIRNCIHYNNKCFKFELHGCKLAGIPTLDCHKKFEMFDLDREIRTEGNQVIYTNGKSHGNCSSQCLQMDKCSVVSYGEDESCIGYPSSKIGHWQITDNFTGTWSAKLCDKDYVELFPSLRYGIKSKQISGVISNVAHIETDSIITSIGYPFSYGSGQYYRWMIKYPVKRYIRIVFSNVSLTHVHEECLDKLLISKKFSTKAMAKDIDHKYNDRRFVMETEETIIFLTFTSCLAHTKITDRGFRAVVTGEETPACFTTDWSSSDWSIARSEICRRPSMIITSMSILNIQPLTVEEAWIIQIEEAVHYTFQLHILDFYVMCSQVSGDIRSRFAVIEMKEERTFCNTDMPLDVIYTKTTNVTVKFQRREDPKTVYLRTEGFRLRYWIKDHSLEKLIDHRLSESKVCSQTFGKCYHVKISLKTWNQASEICRKCEQMLVSVQSEYELQFVNYLLRDYGHLIKTDEENADLAESSFSSHIGLRVANNRHRKNTHSWENGSPVTYFPWKHGYPAVGKDCTRTNFKFISNRTLESEDCTTDLSSYFICETPIKKDEDGKKDLEVCDERENIHSDVVFMIHRSRTSENFNKTIQFVTDLVAKFDIGPHATQIAAVTFAGNVTVEFDFGVVKTTEEAQNKMMEIEQLAGGQASTNLALEVMRFDLFSPSTGARYNVPRIGILLTDEKSTDLSETKEQAKLAKDAGIKLLAIGIKNVDSLDFDEYDVADFDQGYSTDNDQEYGTDYGKDYSTDLGQTGGYLYYDQLGVPDYKEVTAEELEEIVSEPSQENYVLVDGVDKLNLNLRLEILKKLSNTATSVNSCKDVVWKNWKLPEQIKETFSGTTCQTWNKLTTKAGYNFKDRFPDSDITSEANNFCVDPDSSGMLWCYTTGTKNELWEPCFMQWSSLKSKHEFPEDTQKDKNEKVECDDGRLINKFKVCDGVFSCKDFSDETSCRKKGQYLTNNEENRLTEKPPDRIERGSYFLCGSKEWISILAKCDDVIDCVDASDELNCATSDIVSTENVPTCDNDDCLLCDFTPDYKAAERKLREFRACTSSEYTCENDQCIPMDKRCNAIIDCTDGSDENRCDICQDSFHCDEVKCLPLQLKCDENPDCEDGTDENSCEHVDESLSSCDLWWEHGYHTSRDYVIDGIRVYCDFTSIKKARTITMSIHNIDVAIEIDVGKIYTRSVYEHFLQNKTHTFRDLIYRDGYSCFLEVKRTCQFPIAASVIEDSTDNDMLQQCRCIVETFKVETHDQDAMGDDRESANRISFVRHTSFNCDGTEQSDDLINKEYYNVTSDGNFYVDDRILKREMPIQITPVQIICTYEYTNETIICAGEHRTIPQSMLCIYDVDSAGVMTGCRSGSHLQNCGKFECPAKTVKCPGSYCIPLGFVCDGIVQCPGGEDEHECTCTNMAREVLIFVEDAPDYRESAEAAVKLAEQFYTSGSDIRLLHFQTTAPLSKTKFDVEHRLLEIREEQIYAFQGLDTTRECRYKSMARNLLGQIKFSTHYTNGIVFIIDSLESSKVADLMFSNLSKPGFMIYRVLKDANFSVKLDRSDIFRFVKDVPIHRWNALFSTGYKRFPEICKAATHVPCSGGYRCTSSKQCIPLDQVCDGIYQCEGKDDERLCDLFCPHNCICIGHTVNCREANLEHNHTKIFSLNTRIADMSRNPGLKNVLMESSLRFSSMTKLNLSSCEIVSVNKNGFAYLNNLICLDISYNRVKILTENLFSRLEHLVVLNLDGNVELQEISSTAFHGLTNLKRLRITGTKLKQISSYTFAYLTLKSINISYNEITEIEDYAFNGTSVEIIDFRGNNILTFNERIFHGVLMLEELQTSAFKFCCKRPCSVEESNCFPQKNEFSSCKDLMRHPILQAVLWIVGTTALLGNLGSILYRIIYDRARLKIGYGIFVTNLAAADFLMGAYLIMIAIVDSLYRNRYIYFDDKWRNSAWCVTAGVLSTVSSEASVLFVCFITLDRLLVIKYPFGGKRFDPIKAHLCCIISWAFSFLIALIPVVYTGYFENKFYSRSAVCVALPLTRDKPPGWMYSVSVFVGLNFCTFMLVAFGQLSIFLELRKATGGLKKTQISRKRDLQVARNLIFVATTDFMCWFPVGVMGIMALNGYPISGDVYAWTAVFILPLNSALNPILYTLSAIVGKQSFNPNVEEQNRTEIQKETASSVLKHQELIRSVRVKSDVARVGLSVDELLEKDGSIPIDTVVAIGIQLSRYLCHLHESAIGIKELSTKTTYVEVNKKKPHRVNIVVDSKIAVSKDEKTLKDNIYQFGTLLRRLTAKRRAGTYAAASKQRPVN